jgi:hypothetical protein
VGPTPADLGDSHLELHHQLGTQTAPALVPARDSKDPEGPFLVFPTRSFAAFVAALKSKRPLIDGASGWLIPCVVS